MSISNILSTAQSGLQVAQTGLRTVSDNVANVNTPGYVRKIVDQVSVATAGVGNGADVARVRLAADRFLQSAQLRAASGAGESGAAAEFLDQAQSLFGDPGGDASFFDRLDKVLGAFSAVSSQPSSTVLRADAVSAVTGFFEEATRISQGIQVLRTEADARIAAGVDKVNQLLTDIEALNVQISRASVGAGATAGAENAQAGLIDELSKLMEVKLTPRAAGGVTVRTPDGLPLTGDGAATLSYTRAGSTSPETVYGEITVTPTGGQPRPLLDHLGPGELRGLVTMRDGALPALAEQLGEFTTRAADELNRAHNAASAVPAPSRLEGRNTGLDLATAVGGFTGRTSVAITDPSGRVTRKVDIDFTAGTMSVNGGAAAGFTPGSFLTALDAALDPAADASFANGALTLEARGGAGVVVADDPAAPSNKAGRGFSHAFGLNDLLRSQKPALYETGLKTSDPHGFPAGQTLTLRLSAENGTRLRDVTVAVPAGGTVADLLGALNASNTGVGLYGGFSLDAEGRLGFTATTKPPAALSVVRDDTARSGSGVSASAMFGLDAGQRASRAGGFSVRADIAADGRKLGLAQFDVATGVGAIGLSPGDGRGAAALAQAGERTTAFSGGLGFASANSTLSRYAASFGGSVGAQAAAAADRRDAAETIVSEASARRASVEGVDLDEELVLMTIYQQAYSASARLIQAAKDMYDVLLSLP